MKLETLEKFVNKEQDFWTREDLDILIKKYGKTAIFYDTEGLSNRLFLLFKYRDMMEHDEVILDFIKGKNDNYNYIIQFIEHYVMSLDFVMWPSELGLHVIYKVLCDRFLSEDTSHYESLDKEIKKLAKHISLKRYEWIKKMKEDSNGSK